MVAKDTKGHSPESGNADPDTVKQTEQHLRQLVPAFNTAKFEDHLDQVMQMLWLRFNTDQYNQTQLYPDDFKGRQKPRCTYADFCDAVYERAATVATAHDRAKPNGQVLLGSYAQGDLLALLVNAAIDLSLEQQGLAQSKGRIEAADKVSSHAEQVRESRSKHRSPRTVS